MKFLFLILFFLMSLPGFCQEDSEFEDKREVTKTIIDPAFNAAAELQKLGHESINARALADKRVILLIKRMLEHSRIDEVSPEVVKGLINEKLKDSLLGSFLKSNPRIFSLLVDIMRDKRALVGLVEILIRRDDLKSYIHFWIAFLIAAWLLKKATFKKGWGRYRTLLMGMLVSLIITSVSLSVFYNTFHKELSPTLEIISRHWNQKNS